ncbi:hypothetical protein ZOSMA_33G00700 [Zostera marina]|uniref:FAR1 domain-containing protein n=1 Tax=Zostera marina TaxID=29655 RepID=A0A0K9P7R3_ZOSMR|nr:hypothetical protein ZOSMA_33G00700 [Zostera marina]
MSYCRPGFLFVRNDRSILLRFRIRCGIFCSFRTDEECIGSGQWGKFFIMKRLLCSKQGSPSLILPPSNTTRRKNDISRCGCQTSIKFKRIDRSDQWVTDTINLDHNHPLTTPSKVRYLLINRSLSQTSRLLFASLGEVNVPVSQQTAYFSHQLGGVQNMGCTTLDINNMVRDDRIDFKNYDVDLIVEEFELKKSENKDFFYNLVKDDEGRMKHLFLADSTMIENDKLFGDSVTFDTTYKTNVYSMMFDMFCGVNYHWKTTISGSAFSRYFINTFIYTFSFLTFCKKLNCLPFRCLQ